MKYHKQRRESKGLDKFIEGHNRNIMNSFANSEVADFLVGKELTVKITSIGSKGDGIAKYNTYTVIVAGSNVGDEIKIVVKAVRGNLIFAEISEKNGDEDVAMQ